MNVDLRPQPREWSVYRPVVRHQHFRRLPFCEVIANWPASYWWQFNLAGAM
jgi:hypothetical protein